MSSRLHSYRNRHSLLLAGMVSTVAIVVLVAAVLVYRVATGAPNVDIAALNEQAANEVSAAQSSMTASREAVRAQARITAFIGDGGSSYSRGYQDRISAVVAAHPARVVVANGGIDSLAYAAHPEITIMAVKQFFESLHQRLPQVQIIAISPLWNWDVPPVALIGIATAVKLAVSNVGGKYIEIGQPLVRRADWFVADHVHINDIGYATVAAAIDRALGS